MSEEIAEWLQEVRADLRLLLERTEPTLPVALSYERAAKELDISISKLKGLVARQQLIPCVIGKRKMIPRAEIYRITKPQPPTRRGRPPKEKPPDTEPASFRDKLKNR